MLPLVPDVFVSCLAKTTWHSAHSFNACHTTSVTIHEFTILFYEYETVLTPRGGRELGVVRRPHNFLNYKFAPVPYFGRDLPDIPASSASRR